MIDSICALSTVSVGGERKIWILQPFQEYFTHIEPTVYQRWAKAGVFGEKHLTYRWRTWHSTCASSEAQTTAVRDPISKS